MLFDRDVVDLSLRRVMELHQRAVSREQMCRFGGYMAEIFAACGLNLNTSATEETHGGFSRRCLRPPKAMMENPNSSRCSTRSAAVTRSADWAR